MATGILSIAFDLAGWESLSLALLAVGGVCFVTLVGLFALRLATDPPRVWHEAHDVGGLTSVAATGVLGTRVELLGWPAVHLVLWALALGMWLVLMPIVATRWPGRGQGTGSHFLVTVATQAIAILAATLVLREGGGWLVAVAVGFLFFGLALYAVALVAFAPRELLVGHGDHWIAGGALVISALAVAQVIRAIEASGSLAGLEQALRDLDLALWSLAMLWLAVLVACEIACLRLRYHPQRWATVFPLGMYAAMSLVTGEVERIGAIVDLGRVLVWIAFASWCLAALGLARRVRQVLADASPPAHGPPLAAPGRSS